MLTAAGMMVKVCDKPHLGGDVADVTHGRVDAAPGPVLCGSHIPLPSAAVQQNTLACMDSTVGPAALMHASCCCLHARCAGLCSKRMRQNGVCSPSVTMLARASAAAMKVSSRSRVALDVMAPRPMPGKMYAVSTHPEHVQPC